MDARAPGFDPAALKTRKHFHIFCTCRAQECDPVGVQVALVIECSRIEIIPRRMQLGFYSKSPPEIPTLRTCITMAISSPATSPDSQPSLLHWPCFRDR